MTYTCSLLETILKGYERSTKRYIDDQNDEDDEEEHVWIGLGYHFWTKRVTSNCSSITILGMTKLSWLLVGYLGSLLTQAHSYSDWRTLRGVHGDSDRF